MDKMIPLFKPFIPESATNYVHNAISSGWISSGPVCQEFLSGIQNFIGNENICLVNSATSGLYLALKSLNNDDRDEILVPAFTFIATVNVIFAAGYKPIFIDIKANERNIDVSLIQKAVTPRTKAIILVDFAGVPADRSRIYNYAAANRLRVIEDCAHSFGNFYGKHRIGAEGDISVFSFHANKTITCGEGGAVACQSPQDLEKIKLLAFHGISKEPFLGDYKMTAPSLKFNMSDLHAALGLSCLKAVNHIFETRKHLFNCYKEMFFEYGLQDHFLFPEIGISLEHNALSTLCLTLNSKLKHERNNILKTCYSMGVQLGVHWPSLDTIYPSVSMIKIKKDEESIASDISKRTITLPYYVGLTETRIKTVLKSLKKASKS